jgi:methylsterol monooxygenase
MIFDLTSRPKILRKYKIQEGTNEPLEWDKFVGLVKQIVWNQVKIEQFHPCALISLHL